MTGAKTNERPGTRAVLRGYQMSASKARVVLNLIRGEDVTTAREILAGTTREAADVIGKLLASAVANAVTNDGLQAEELYVSAAYADEGITMKRFSPRARGRAGKIFKRSTHITVIVSRLDEERLELLRTARNAQAQASRARRVASSRRRADQTKSVNKREAAHEAQALAEAQEAEDAALIDETASEATAATIESSDETEVPDEAEAETAVDEATEAESSDETSSDEEETN
jgi:large subunit ribosomal protein L22